MKKRLKGLMGRTGRIGAVAVALLQLAGPALAASEMHAPQVFYRDVAVSTWAPTVTVSSITSTNGGAFSATGAWFYAVAAQNSLGKTTNGPVTNVTVTATGYFVRVTWPSVGGATNYLLYRGSTASNLTNYVAVAQQGVTNVYVDYGTNAWTVGTPSNSITTVPWLKLPSASYTPTGNDAVRASDIAGFDASNFYTRAQADAAFVNTNETNSVTTQMIQDGTIVGADLAANAITPEAMGTNVAVSVTNFDGSVDVRYLNASGVDSQYGTVIVNHETVTGAFTLASGRGIQTTGTVGGAALVAQHSTAVDLQTVRTDTNSVASGNGSAVLAGRNNRASGSWSTTVGGQNNQALANYAIAGGISAVASGAAAVAMGYAPNAGADYSAAFGYSPSATHTGSFVWSDSAIGVWGAGGATSLRDYDFTVRAFGGARFFTGTNGLVVYNSSTVGVIRIGGPEGGVVIGTNSFKLDASGNVTATDVYMRIAVGRSNDQPVTVGQMVDSNAMKQARPTNAWALYYSDGASNLVPVQLGQAGSVPVSQGSNSPPLMQLPTATATNVAMSNLLDVAGTAWNTNFLLRFNGTAWQAVDQTNLTVGTALNANLLDGYDSSAFQLYLGAVTNNGGFLVGFTNGTYGWAPSLTASATNVIDSAVTVTHSATNYTASTNNAQAHLRGIDARLAVLAAGTGNASRIHSRAISTNAPSHGDVYQWDTNTASWIPAAVSGGGGSSTNVTAANVIANGGGGTNSGQLALGEHNHDAMYVNEAQTNSVTTDMVTDGTLGSVDMSAGALTIFTNDRVSLVVAGTGSVSVTATTNNNATVYTVNGPGPAGGGGVTNLYDLNLVDAVTPAAGQALIYDGAVWTNAVTTGTNVFPNGVFIGPSAFWQTYYTSDGPGDNNYEIRGTNGNDTDIEFRMPACSDASNSSAIAIWMNNSGDTNNHGAFGLHAGRGLTGDLSNGFSIVSAQIATGKVWNIEVLVDNGVQNAPLLVAGFSTNGYMYAPGGLAISTNIYKNRMSGRALWIEPTADLPSPELGMYFNADGFVKYGFRDRADTSYGSLGRFGTSFGGIFSNSCLLQVEEGGWFGLRLGDTGGGNYRIPFVVRPNAGGDYVGINVTNPTVALDVAGTVQVKGGVVPGTSNAYDLGTEAMPWRSLYLQTNSLHFIGDPSGPVSISSEDGKLLIRDGAVRLPATVQTVLTVSVSLLSFLLLINFLLDKRERRRDAARFAELERLIKGSAVHDR